MEIQEQDNPTDKEIHLNVNNKQPIVAVDNIFVNMITVTFTVRKANVYDEVAKTTSYTGAKMTGDATAYQRIFTTDADRLMLERFWTEACNAVADLFKPFLTSISDITESHHADITKNFTAVLELSGSYDTALNQSIESSLFSFFTNLIVSKWYEFSNKNEAEKYATAAAAMLEDVRSKIYFRKKPRRIPPTETE